MIKLRKTIAIASLLTIAALASMTPAPSYPNQDDLRVAVFPLLIPLGLTIIGLVRSRPWARWLSLATAIALFPWAVALASEGGYGQGEVEAWVVLVASVLLLLTLTGKAAYDGFEGLDAQGSWAGRRMALVRWTVICNVAAVVNLWMFATAYTPTAAWQALIPGLSAVGLVVGVGFLARQKTIGLLIMAIACLVFPPAAFYFLAQQTVGTAEEVLFVFLFLPGWISAVASLVSFSGPLLRFAKD